MNKMKNIKHEISSLINKMDQSQRENKDQQNEVIQEDNEPAEKEVDSNNYVNTNLMTNYDVTTTNRTQQTSGHAMYEVMKKLTENQYNVNSDPNILSEP